MKRKIFYAAFALVFLAEIIVLTVFAVKSPEHGQDAVAVNRVLNAVERDFDDLDNHKNPTSLDYVVLNANDEIVFPTSAGLSVNVEAAIAHGDSVISVERDGKAVGKVIIFNDAVQEAEVQKRVILGVSAGLIASECLICLGYCLYLYIAVIKPFKKLKGFAERVAGGNLDIPLEMDRGNLFGAFTESFDIMRSELKKSRLAEAQAQQSKKELVAKLSHDIKTPVASIKAVSEVGLAVTANGRDKENYAQIIAKSDQINTLITNLFTATLEELQQLSVTPTHFESGQIKTLLQNADYLSRANLPDIPELLVYADKLRLQQVFDNIFANSYKYADTEITVKAERCGNYLKIETEDCGGGVPAEELPTLKEKFRRGSNSAHTEGAGLGLYISDYFMKEMGGALKIENGKRGLKVTVTLALSGK